MPPKLSIITVCYNAEASIEKTLLSVKNQTFQDLEYLIQDGGSIDGTLKLIEQQSEGRFKVCSEKDEGIYDAFNKALARSTGEYVCFLNAGDLFYDNNVLARVFEQSDGEDFVYGDAIMVDLSGKTRPWYKRKPFDTEISYKSFINGMAICHQAMFVKRSKCQSYQERKWQIANDLDWAIRTLRCCERYKDVDIPVVYFSDGGISDQRRWKALIERFEILHNHFGLIATLLQHVRIIFQALRRRSFD